MTAPAQTLAAQRLATQTLTAQALAARASALGRAARRYRGGGRFARHYVASKLRTDPVYGTLLDLGISLDAETPGRGPPNHGPLGHVVDVGCGRGQLAALLLEAGLAERVTGLDWQRTHLAQAAAALAGLRFEGHARDLATDQSLPDADTVVLCDVLYQLTTEVQLRLLDSAGRAARRHLLIRTLDRGQGARGRFALAAERCVRRFWPSSGAHVNPLTVAAIAARMTAAGFAVETRPSFQGTPFANVLLLGRRRGA